MVKKNCTIQSLFDQRGFLKIFSVPHQHETQALFSKSQKCSVQGVSTTFIAFFFAFSLYFSVTCKRQEDILALITMPNSCLSLYLILKREIFSSLITFQDTILSWQASSGILFYVSVSRKDTFQEIVSPFIHLSDAQKNVAHHRHKKSLKNPQKAVKQFWRSHIHYVG